MEKRRKGKAKERNAGKRGEEDSSNWRRGTIVRRSIIGRSSGYLPSEQKDEERARIFGQIKG